MALKVTGLRLSEEVIKIADNLIPLLQKDIVRYPGAKPNRSDVLRQAMVIGLQQMERDSEE
jgi:hypothetical protein|tara:strand:+ start:248 stop:430 length:183 start_codon:yes stop_codon:yes gene_type:complete